MNKLQKFWQKFGIHTIMFMKNWKRSRFQHFGIPPTEPTSFKFWDTEHFWGLFSLDAVSNFFNNFQASTLWCIIVPQSYKWQEWETVQTPFGWLLLQHSLILPALSSVYISLTEQVWTVLPLLMSMHTYIDPPHQAPAEMVVILVSHMVSVFVFPENKNALHGSGPGGSLNLPDLFKFFFQIFQGRRPLLLMSLGGVILSLLLLSGSFALVSRNSPHAVNYDPHAKFPSCDVASTCDQCLTSLDQCGFCIPAGEQNGLCVSSQNKK